MTDPACDTLLLDSTLVDVTLLPPLAHLVVVRRFTNRTSRLVEALLTLPPLAPLEVVYRLIVHAGPLDWSVAPVQAGPARCAHDAAIADGRRAILYELRDGDLQRISIAGIAPGTQLEVQVWSIRPMDRPDSASATLWIPLNLDPAMPCPGLDGADAPITTSASHPVDLRVHFGCLTVDLSLPNDTLLRLERGAEISVPCTEPVRLKVAAPTGGTLDRREWQVGEPGGWEVTSPHGIEHFRHPRNPRGTIVSERKDWIFGTIATDAGEIRVTAPLPEDGIAPNARALRAMAAAGFVEADAPLQPEAVRRAVKILTRQTSLAFIGPAGETSGEVPWPCRLALPDPPPSFDADS